MRVRVVLLACRGNMVKPDGHLALLRFHTRMCAMRTDTFMVKYKIKLLFKAKKQVKKI